MVTTLLKSIAAIAFLCILFWLSAYDWIGLVLLVVWILAIGVLLHSDLAQRFLWIPVALALAGLFGSMIMLAIPGAVTLAANVVILALLFVSLEVLKKRRSSLVCVRVRAW